jgi:hypothetical protein
LYVLLDQLTPSAAFRTGLDSSARYLLNLLLDQLTPRAAFRTGVDPVLPGDTVSRFMYVGKSSSSLAFLLNKFSKSLDQHRSHNSSCQPKLRK